MNPLTSRDWPAVAVTGVVSVPVAIGLFLAAVAQPADAVIDGAVLILWLVIALPVAVLTCRAVPRHIPTEPPPTVQEDWS